MGTISVVVPAYNQGRFLLESLGSVFAQTRKPDEIIVIDDASSDTTSEIIRDYRRGLSARERDKLRYIRHNKNLGPIPTFNDGLAACSGDYIIFLPADDWFAPTILEEEAAILDENHQIAVVYAQAFDVIHNRKKLTIDHVAGNASYIGRSQDFSLFLTRGDFIPLPTALFRRKAVENVGKWDTRLRFYADYEFWIRLARQYPFAYVAKPLAYYRVHGRNDHLNPEFAPSYEREFAYILKKHLPEESGELAYIRTQAYHNYFFRLYNERILAGRFLEAWPYWWRAFVEKPLSLSHLRLWMPFGWYLRRRIAV